MVTASCIAIERLAKTVTRPEQEVIEYVKRDVANVVLCNKDDHARNTAMQRLADGTVRLTPVFDFAPMVLHLDGIARRMRWERDDGGASRWQNAIAQCREVSGLALAADRARCATSPSAWTNSLRWPIEWVLTLTSSRASRPASTMRRSNCAHSDMGKRYKPLTPLEQLHAREQLLAAIAAHPEWTFVQTLRHVRASLRMTLDDMAKVSKVSQQTLRNIEADTHSPSLETATRLLKPFGLRLCVAPQTSET